MNDIYDALTKLASSGGRGVLVEVSETAGSAPRKAGARMLLSPEGLFSGTVGGGGIEYRAQQEARRALETGEPLKKTYSLAGPAAPGEDIGAICGGSVTLDFRLVGAAEAAALLEDLPRPPRVLLYGAGHVGKALADALHLLALPVIVTDERAGLLTAERFPHAETRLAPFAEAPMEPEARDLIAIMTPGHTFDYGLLRRAMDTPAFYIGLVASRRKSALFRQRLEADGVSPEDIARRVHCPIGLAIRAETPEEIAVSIAAEMIAAIHPART